MVDKTIGLETGKGQTKLFGHCFYKAAAIPALGIPMLFTGADDAILGVDFACPDDIGEGWHG